MTGTNRKGRNWIVGLLLAFAATGTARAQSNTIDGLDGFMAKVDGPVVLGRVGTFPDGTNALAFDATICNIGTVPIEWKQAMNPDHPIIAFLIARENLGRFEQINDRSYIKHTFFATNSSSCDPCSDNSDPTVLELGCSDTYSADTNGDRYWLGPPEELDPWLMSWDPVCSYFDRGDPAVAPPADCDGVRSLTQGQVNRFGAIKNRVKVTDDDMNFPAATYYFWGEYLLRGEADALRDDTCASRQFIPTWNGTNWDVAQQGGMIRGTILKRWSGSTVRSNTNGNDDGRVFLASVVTGPDTNGNYHYEYAIHNRDNVRGLDEFQVPIRPGATVVNAGFGDIDNVSGNEWKITVGATDVRWSTFGNGLEWNTIYNFWFDCDAPPATDTRALVSEFRAGPGLDAFDIFTSSPTGPDIGKNLGSGKVGGNGLVPDLAISGGLDLGENADVMVRYAAPNAFAFVFISDENLGFPFRGGTIVPFPPDYILPTCMDGDGNLFAHVDGVGGPFDLFMQIVVLDPGAEDNVAMTNALEVTL